jgi:hypothetical protein
MDPAAITAAIRSLAALEQLHWNPTSRPPGVTSPDAAPSALLRAVGPAVFAEIAAAIPTATGTGRIALAQLAATLDPERGARLIADLRHDNTAAWVDTCIVGFRSVSQWARTQAPASRPRTDSPPAPTRRAVPWLALATITIITILAAIALLAL